MSLAAIPHLKKDAGEYHGITEGLEVYQQILKSGRFKVSDGKYSFRLLQINKEIVDQQAIFYTDKIKPLFLDLMSKWPFSAFREK